MRRYLAGALLVLMITQSSGTAVARTSGNVAPVPSLRSLFDPIVSYVTGTKLYAQFTGDGDRYTAMHAARPVIRKPEKVVSATSLFRSEHPLEPRARRGTLHTFEMPPRSALDPRHRIVDPLAMHPSIVRSGPNALNTLSRFLGPETPIGVAPTASQSMPRNERTSLRRREGGARQLTAANLTTGLERWWTYEERAIPGIGKAMLNVGTGNLVVSALDVDVHEQGIDLAFQRVYNTQSLHDYNGDDGGDPAIFGNRWTNNFDANIVYDANANTITVYDLDGTACTYTANIQMPGGWQPCTGEHAILSPTDSNDCTYEWQKPDGTLYWFHTDQANSGCGLSAAKRGHIQEIFGRNQTNHITFAYHYDGNGYTSENITEIDANHSDGHSLVMTFGIVPNTSINELKTITRPDLAVLKYLYDSSGNLVEVDKPGNNSAASIQNPPSTLPTGDVPETYAYSQGTSNLEQACGPRCTVAMWNNPNSPSDGAAIVFTMDGSLRLTAWQVQGVLNFTPSDSTSTPLQSGPSNQFTSWDTTSFVYGAFQVSPCGGTASGTTTMCDTNGHASIWTIDSSGRVTGTQEFSGANSSVITSQSWDSNNNLVATTDANNYMTQYGYDGNGNAVEVQLPAGNDYSAGTTPLSFYSYDTYNNVTFYCDPVWTQANGKVWVPPTDSLCPGGSGTTRLAYTTSDPNERYGCLSQIQRPGGYATSLTYSGGSGSCGIGLPTGTAATAVITQYDNSTRTPTQDLSYDSYGNLHTYDKGEGNGGTYQDSWTLGYNPENQLDTRTENDASIPLTESSKSCYYPDGAVAYTETPSQHYKDGDPICPNTQAFLNGSNAMPPHADQHYYDLDGDDVKTITHKGCSPSTQCSGASSKTACQSSEQNPPGTTCKYYDGLDRVVETIEPYDSRTFPGAGNWGYEWYNFRWMNRYIYDLSESGGGANLTIADNTGSISGLVAYGGLYKTQEYLPTNKIVNLSDGETAVGSWYDVRGSSFDGLDRPISKYELAFGTAPASTNTYDTNGQVDLLAKIVNAMGQQTSYMYDSAKRVKEVDFSGTQPIADSPRTYTFDPDGRTASSVNSLGSINYAYDVDGNETSITEPQNENAYSLICYYYYGDGLREYVSIGPGTVTNCQSIQQSRNPSNGGISQPHILSYAYRNDGLLANQLASWITVQDLFSWNYYPSGREQWARDPLRNVTVPVPQGSPVTLGQKSYTYDGYGRVASLTLPEGYNESSFVYDDEDEILGYNQSNSTLGPFARQITLNSRGEILEDVPNVPAIPWTQGVTYSANGTQVGNGNVSGQSPVQAPPTTLQFDSRTGMVTASTDPGWSEGLSSGADVYSYDGAGRQTGRTYCSTWPTGCSNPSQIKEYDSENHIETTLYPDGHTSGVVTWGPDGRHRVDDNYTEDGSQTPTQAHWDGDSLLFTTGQFQAGPYLYVGKSALIDVAGDIYVDDRDQRGTTQSSHGNILSNNFGALGPWFNGWSLGSVRPINVAKAGKTYDLQILTGSCNFTELQSPYNFIPCPSFGPSFPMTRSDGYGMIGGIVQGERTFDPVSGQWLTPDPYAGDVRNPMSQKPFIWAGNNPVEWADPSGYLLDWAGNAAQRQQEQDDWKAIKDYFKNDPKATAILNNLENNKSFTVTISENNIGETHFDGEYKGDKLTSDTLRFDPKLAVKLTNDPSNPDAMSPADAFMHEADHANRFNTDYSGYAQDITQTKGAGSYGNMEEKRVMTGLEAEILKSQGLPARTEHDTPTCVVSSLFSNNC